MPKIRSIVFTAFFITLIFLRTETGEAANDQRHATNTYTLKEIYRTTLDKKFIDTQIAPLVQAGFPKKRAKEIVVADFITTVFQAQYKMTSLTDVVRQTLRKTFTIAFHKNNEGTIDNLYIGQVANFKTLYQEKSLEKYNAYLNQYSAVSITYNEVHYLEDGEQIPPFIISLELVKERNPSEKKFHLWQRTIDIFLKRPCGQANLMAIPLKWLGTLRDIGKILKSRLKESRYTQTMTFLYPDGTLLLYEVQLKLLKSKL